MLPSGGYRLEGGFSLPYQLAELVLFRLQDLHLVSQVVKAFLEAATLVQDLVDLTTLKAETGFKVGDLDVLVADLELGTKELGARLLQTCLKLVDELFGRLHVLVFTSPITIGACRRLHHGPDTVLSSRKLLL